MSDVIVDTGPPVAMLVRTDRYHAWSVAQLRELRPPFLTCEAVLAETAHLVRKVPQGTDRFVDLLMSDLLQVDLDVMAERTVIGRLMRRYADRPMSLADACLVRLAELHEGRPFSPSTAISPCTASTAGERSRSSRRRSGLRASPPGPDGRCATAAPAAAAAGSPRRSARSGAR